MAFQPIVDVRSRQVFAYEALARGPRGEPARTVLEQVKAANIYSFDQQCRVTAIELAARLGIAERGAMLSINFMPNAVYEPRACIRLTLQAAERVRFPRERIIFEFTETERLDTAHTLSILESYRDMGFKTAIDDFGAGYAGLGLLTRFRPDIVKLDMELIRGVHDDAVKRKILGHVITLLRDLEIVPLAEGVETAAEQAVLADLGVDLMQGYLFSKPAFEALGEVSWGV
jgi:EAL domain-containing protein (putative c-di-GMP-specific phosphodiesterase class I)